MKTTLYQILGVEPGASKEAIAAAYRAAVDNARTQRGDPNAATFLHDAYRILSDNAQRAAYDASIARAQRVAAAGAVVEPRASSGWMPWLLGLVVVTGAIAVWQWRKPPAPPPVRPVVAVESVQGDEVRVTIVPPSTARPRAPESATPIAAAPARDRSAEDIFVQLAPSVVRVNVLDGSGVSVGSGSGVVIERDTVITNCHVAKRSRQLTVRIGGETRAASLTTADEQYDLCRLNVPGLQAPAVEMGSVESLRTGQKVFTIGAPLGLDLTISEGIVSSLRTVAEGTVIQTTAPISPGSSGGGLFDSAGRLVGITTFQHRYGQNLNFALPADWIGRMQTRTVEAGQPGRYVPAPVAGGGDLAGVLVGRWLCYGPLTGRNGEYTFAEDGTMSVVIGGKAAVGQYALRGKALWLSGAGVTLAIEELTAQKMILNAGEGRRLICQR